MLLSQAPVGTGNTGAETQEDPASSQEPGTRYPHHWVPGESHAQTTVWGQWALLQKVSIWLSYISYAYTVHMAANICCYLLHLTCRLLFIVHCYCIFPDPTLSCCSTQSLMMWRCVSMHGPLEMMLASSGGPVHPTLRSAIMGFFSPYVSLPCSLPLTQISQLSHRLTFS